MREKWNRNSEIEDGEIMRRKAFEGEEEDRNRQLGRESEGEILTTGACE